MKAPIFSIITVSFNAESTIEKTVKSALGQTFKNFEIIVKDCCSQDDTLKMIPEDERIKVLSEKDNGIYDAMNRAVALSSGKYLVFMNCGDLFASENVLEDVVKAIETEDDVIYGNYIVNGNLHIQTSRITDFYLYRTPLCHQSMIIKRDLFETLNGYNCNYEILADYDFTHRSRMIGAKFKYIGIPICIYLGGGVSEAVKGVYIKENERKEILKKYYPLIKRFKYDTILVLSFRKFRIWLMSGHSPKWFKVLYKKIVNKVNSR